MTCVEKDSGRIYEQKGWSSDTGYKGKTWKIRYWNYRNMKIYRKRLQKAKGPVQATGTAWIPRKYILCTELGKDGGFPWKLVVTYDDQRAREIYDDFRSFTENVWLYPAKDLLFYSADIHGNLMTRQRIAVWRHLMEDEGRRGSHYVRRPYGSSAAAGIFKAAGGDCGKRPDHGSG